MTNSTKKQMNIPLLCAALIAFSGGYMDAYTFLYRDKVFANAQTGNMIMLMWNILEKQYDMALKYLFPICAFLVGIAMVNVVLHHSNPKVQLYYREVMMGIEAVILLLVAFVPTSMNHLANAMVSLSCGIQVESIRRIGSNNIATTMCIGNLRNMTYNFTEYLYTREKSNLKKALMYLNINLAFVLGAAAEGVLRYWLGMPQKLIMVSSALIVAAILVMLYGRRKLG